MPKKVYFGSNLKMYKNIRETSSYIESLDAYTKDLQREDMELFIIPSYTALETAVNITRTGQIKIGAQNMHWEETGQYTGEISPLMLKELGADIVMAGHSERRHVFGETDIDINKKVLSALKHGFTVLLCVGETGVERELGISREILRMQIKTGLHGICENQIKRVWIAYEPVWSIGTEGTPASPDYAEEMHGSIKETLGELFGEASEEVPVIYGGSVNIKNATALMAMPSVDGLFVGRAAWKAGQFDKIIRQAAGKSYNSSDATISSSTSSTESVT